MHQPGGPCPFYAASPAGSEEPPICASRLQQKKQAPGPPAVHQARCSVTQRLLGKAMEKKAWGGDRLLVLNQMV